jgi:hypothetical protein
MQVLLLLMQAVEVLLMGLLLVCGRVARLLLRWRWSQLQQQERQGQEQRGKQQVALQVWQGQAGTQRPTWRWMPLEVCGLCRLLYVAHLGEMQAVEAAAVTLFAPSVHAPALQRHLPPAG